MWRSKLIKKNLNGNLEWSTDLAANYYKIIRNVNDNGACKYIDEILMYAKKVEKHQNIIKLVLRKFNIKNKINLSKFWFYQIEIIVGCYFE